MAYEITLKDSTRTWTSPSPNTPLTEQTIESSAEVTTMDLNLYVDLFAVKKMWTVTWGYMNSTDYAILQGFYNRQFTALELPVVNIPDLGVGLTVVKMSLSDKRIVSDQGTVENVEITLRETVQATDSYVNEES